MDVGYVADVGLMLVNEALFFNGGKGGLERTLNIEHPTLNIE